MAAGHRRYLCMTPPLSRHKGQAAVMEELPVTSKRSRSSQTGSPNLMSRQVFLAQSDSCWVRTHAPYGMASHRLRPLGQTVLITMAGSRLARRIMRHPHRCLNLQSLAPCKRFGIKARQLSWRRCVWPTSFCLQVISNRLTKLDEQTDVFLHKVTAVRFEPTP